MSHAFPLAASVEDALKLDVRAARTRAEAENLAEGRAIAGLVTDWLTLEPQALADLLAANFVTARGHLQRYEDEAGHPVVAITWWKLAPVQKASKAKPAKPKAEPAADLAPTEDHTDDLYFRSGRTKTRSKKAADPNQMNLFDPPDKN